MLPVYTFGDFVLDPRERSLFHKGQPVPLAPKVYEVLLLLVENAGHLVEKDEFMRRIWPDTFVGEDTLSQNISHLRKALTDGAGGPPLVVTVPRLGYRFTGTVREEINEPASGTETIQPPLSEKEPAQAREFIGFRPSVLILGAIMVGTLAGLITYFLLEVPAVPRLTRLTQLTFSSRVDPWGRLVSDGARIYFLEREGDRWNLVQTSMAGGQSQIVPAPFRNTRIFDVSSDRAEFLVGSFLYRDTEMPLWTWPVQGGPPTRVGDVNTFDASWHPSGRQIVYAKEDGIFLADRDGSHCRRLATTNGRPYGFAWSPDHARMRFTVAPVGPHSSSIWEMNADGSNLHQLFQGWNNPPMECCGSWSADGRYFFFTATRDGAGGLWAVWETPRFRPMTPGTPFQISAGQPVINGAAFSSSDGHTLYTTVSSNKSELVSYSERSRRFTTVLSNRHTEYVSYSRNGEWMAYSVAPDNGLWRETVDGSFRSPLTQHPIFALTPAWSPDATQIALSIGSRCAKTNSI